MGGWESWGGVAAMARVHHQQMSHAAARSEQQHINHSTSHALDHHVTHTTPHDSSGVQMPCVSDTWAVASWRRRSGLEAWLEAWLEAYPSSMRLQPHQGDEYPPVHSLPSRLSVHAPTFTHPLSRLRRDTREGWRRAQRWQRGRGRRGRGRRGTGGQRRRRGGGWRGAPGRAGRRRVWRAS